MIKMDDVGTTNPDEFKNILMGYICCADWKELAKLFAVQSENQLVRESDKLNFVIPFPISMTKERRVVSPIYLAVATGCVESVKILLDELNEINIEYGIELKKKNKNEEEDPLVKVGNYVRKRTPLQLASALGLYKIVD